MKRILLALGILVSSVVAASATCTSPAVMKDNASTTFNMSLATNAGDGNCASNFAIPDGSAVTMGALADAASSAGGTGSLSAKLRLMTTQLGTLNTSLGTIITTLGSPFQAGGSIGNTTFAATQGTSPWVVSNGGTFAVQATLQSSPTTAIGKVDPNTLATWGLVGIAPGTAPTNALVGGLICNNGTLSPTSGQSAALQGDTACNLKVAVESAVGTAIGTAVSGITGSPILAAAYSAEPAKCTTALTCWPMTDLVGKQVTSPYAPRELMLRCAVTITASTAATTCTGMGAQGASVKIYITDLCVMRSDAGTTADVFTLNDTATTILIVPNNGGGGGVCKTYNVPLVVAANTAFTGASTTSLSSVYMSATGFAGY